MYGKSRIAVSFPGEAGSDKSFTCSAEVRGRSVSEAMPSIFIFIFNFRGGIRCARFETELPANRESRRFGLRRCANSSITGGQRSTPNNSPSEPGMEVAPAAFHNAAASALADVPNNGHCFPSLQYCKKMRPP